MKKLIIFIIGIVLVIICLFGTYNFLLSAPSKENKVFEFDVEKGSTYISIAKDLKKEKFIRSDLAYKIYLKLNPVEEGLEYGRYYLPINKDVKGIIEVLKKGSDSLSDTKSVTFVEGKNMRYIISNIKKNFKISEKDILSKLSSNDYLDRLIEKYWFLTNDIKNKDIYYSLEGYLYPDTYEYYEDADIEDIFGKMLDNMESKLEPYKTEIENSKYSIHEMLTLASIIEQEAGNANDRKGVAGVFYNRLQNGWSLGSDVTTYYAEKLDNYSKDLKKSELSKCNAYNTRSSCMAGKLPVGPICNPGLESIIASIEPTQEDYYYFVADKTGKTYFSKTDSEHNSTVNRLKSEGLWIEYEE